MDTSRDLMILSSKRDSSQLMLDGKYSSWFLQAVSTILFVPFLLFLRFVGGTWLVSNHQYPAVKQSLLLAVILFGTWLLLKVIRREGFYRSGLEIALLPFLVIVFLSSIFSDNPSLSAEKAAGIAFYFVLALLMLDLRKRDWMWSGLINSILIVSLTTAALSLFFIGFAWNIYQLHLGDLFSGFSTVLDSLPRMPAIANLHVTISAVYYLMVIPLFVFRSVGSRKNLMRYVYLLCALILFGIVILMRSRGAILGVMVMLASLLSLQWPKIKGLMKRYPAVTMVVGFILVSVLFLGFYYVIDRRGFDLGGITVVCRLQAWKISIETLKDNPLLGSGLETFGYRFLTGKDPAICPNILHVTHNDLLQILVNFGLLGLASLVYFVVKYVRKISEHFRPEGYYGIVSIAAMAGMGLVTTTLYSPNIVFLLIFNLIWMLPENSILRDPGKAKTGAWVGAGLSLLLALGLWTLWKLEPYFKARLDIEDRNWVKAELNLEEAIKRDPSLGYYRLSLAFVRNQASCASGQPDNDVLGDYLLLEDYAGDLPEYRESLAVLWLERDQYQDALQQLDEATRLAPEQSLSYCLKGMIYWDQGNIPKTQENLAICIALKPSWLDTPFWDSLALDPGIEREILSRAGGSSVNGREVNNSRVSGLVSYYTGAFEQALVSLDPYLQDHPKDYEAHRIAGLAALAIGDNSRAAQLAEIAVKANPRCNTCWTALGEIALISGDADKARHALAISDYLGPTPLNTFLLSDLYAQQGAAENEFAALVRTVDYYYSPNFYSHWLSSRWHFTNGHDVCVPVGLTYNDYYLPISEAGNKLKSYSCGDVQELYAKAVSPDVISIDYFTSDLKRMNCNIR